VLQCLDDVSDKSKSSVSANPKYEPPIESNFPAATAQPLYFTSGNCTLFAWLHSPSRQPPASMGLVVCKPFGFEAMSAHLSIRAFAEAAAEIGIPTLRFDYGGTGDSGDLAPGADQLDAWLQDVTAAVQELQRRTAVERVCLLGFRLGALLAAMAAPRLPQVCGLIAVAPIISGKRYLRELRTFELAAAALAAHTPSRAQIPSPEAEWAGAGHMEVSGFFLNARTMAALQEIDLLALPTPPVSDALVIDREDLPGARAWKDALSAGGIRTQYAVLPGFLQMMMRAPNLTVVPDAMIAAARDWLAQEHGVSSIAPVTVAVRPKPEAVSSSPVLRLGDDPAVMLAEHPVILRPEPLLFGIVTLPPEGEARRRGVILLNSGGDHHIGPRRLYVRLAREWAKRGYVVMRMDLSGLGDSAAHPGQPRNEMFPVAAIDDIRVAVECLRSQHAVHDITLVGSCSGASHAMRAGIVGVPVNRILLINPLVFFWEDGTNMSDVQPWEVVHKPAAYLGRALSAESWRRLLFGDVSIWRVAQIYLHRPVLALQTQLRDLARALRIRLKNDLGWALKDLKARGVRIVFVFSRGDAGMRLLQLQSGLSAKRLAERGLIRTIDGADHEFTRSGARAALVQALSEELYAHDSAGIQRSVANDRDSLHALPVPPIGLVAPPPKRG
jgi:alpha-beta hydrolase superfamily lysophospholipase